MIPVHDYLYSQIAAARQADRIAEAANRRLVREVLTARRAAREAAAAERPARRTRPLRLALRRRPGLAS